MNQQTTQPSNNRQYASILSDQELLAIYSDILRYPRDIRHMYLAEIIKRREQGNPLFTLESVNLALQTKDITSKLINTLH